MQPLYPFSFGWSCLGHLATAIFVALLGMVKGLSCQQQVKEPVQVVEFLVDVTKEGPLMPDPPPPRLPDPPAPVVPDPPVPAPPAPPPVVIPKPDEPKKTVKPPIKVNTNVVVRAPAPKPATPAPGTPAVTPPTRQATSPGRKLSAEDIAKLIAQGATPSTRTVIPGEDDRALALIKNALHTAWIMPTADQKGRRPAEVEIRMDRFGNLLGRRMTASSGSAALDESALRAAMVVRSIPNLPPGYAERNPVVVVDFELE